MTETVATFTNVTLAEKDADVSAKEKPSED